jgi:hypothetical protein
VLNWCELWEQVMNVIIQWGRKPHRGKTRTPVTQLLQIVDLKVWQKSLKLEHTHEFCNIKAAQKVLSNIHLHIYMQIWAEDILLWVKNKQMRSSQPKKWLICPMSLLKNHHYWNLPTLKDKCPHQMEDNFSKFVCHLILLNVCPLINNSYQWFTYILLWS